jgi:transcription antitermination factor NusG
MSWSLVVTAPHRERAVAAMLATFELPYHLFRELRQQVWRGRVITKPFPIFPGYIFAQCHGLYDTVRAIGGVLGFVRFGEQTVFVEDKVVAQLVDASVDDVLPLRVVPAVSRFHSGDRVRVQGANVLAGQVAIFQKMLLGNQALVDIDWMGRWVPVPIDERDLELDISRRRRRRKRPGRRYRDRLKASVATGCASGL